MIRTVGLISCYREGSLIRSAVESLAPLDYLLAAEGPVEGNVSNGPPSELALGRSGPRRMLEGVWETDAAKRTAMVLEARHLWGRPGVELWGLWLDGDEILLWGEYLHDWLERVSQQGDGDNPVGGWPLALVELDGSTSLCMGKLLRIDLVRRYLVSSSYLELEGGSRRTVGNVLYWSPKDGPLFEHWRARPPLQGEPHLLHRPILRDRGRDVERQHVAEERHFRGVELPASGPIPS
jgi:hypothetical protein